MKSLSPRMWALPALLAGLLCGGAHAGPYTFVSDPSNDATGGSTFEVYGIGYKVENGLLDLYVATNYPQTGANGSDSYSSNAHYLPGDLYINVGGSHNLGTGTTYGLGITSHSGSSVTTDPSEKVGLPWSPVTAGHLYSNAVFGTGTNESYPYAGPTGSPYDGDGNNNKNSYPTLIAAYGSDLGAQTLSYNTVTGKPWKYEIAASIDASKLNLSGQAFELWWAIECGNDAAMVSAKPAPPVPEPTTFAMLAFGGLAGLLRRRRRVA